jgi:uncharacterized cupin superfamily protein
VREHGVERSRHPAQVERIDENARVADLAATAAAHEAPQLGARLASVPGRLFLEGAEGTELALGADDLLDGIGPEGTDELVLEVVDAGVEPEPFHVGATQVRAEAAAFEAAPEIALLCRIEQPGEGDIETSRAERAHEAADRLRPADGDDGDSLGVEVPAAPRCQGLERHLVAHALDQDDGARAAELHGVGHASYRTLGRMVEEARLQQTEHGLVPETDGWFVMNARDARWRPGRGRGAFCIFEGSDDFPQLGIHLVSLAPGEPMAMYHWEADQEDFLMLAGEALLIIEGEERPLRRWDFVHCPPGTKHVIVGAGRGQCLVLAAGARDRSTGPDWGGYTFDEAAIRHGAGVERETADPNEAYARFGRRQPAAYREGWLPQ